MTDYAKALKDMAPEKDWLVAIDSDGCVFDTMGIKQRECFCPWMITYFNLQPVAEAVRQSKEFTDLFSRPRGVNRHKAIVSILTEVLPSHPKVKAYGFQVPKFEYYCNWVNDPDSLLSNEGLQMAIDEADSDEAKAQLTRCLQWSKKVNEAILQIVKNVPPFMFVKESLQKISEKADIIVCSSTPGEALQREWAEHDVAKYTKVIAGQEMGKKAEHLAIISEKYDKDKILMVGDAPGDRNAALVNDLLFYPINPGAEEQSWKRFHDEAFDKFIEGSYAGEYEEKVIAEFDECLPENPPWLK